MSEDGPIYQKYWVSRRDDAELDPKSKHYGGCSMFVLDYTHDPYARMALAAYAEACETAFPVLAHDIRRSLTAEESVTKLLDLLEPQ